MNTNSGTRYFYTDPAAVVWMAQHFGMEFFGGGASRIDWVTLQEYEFESGFRLCVPLKWKAFIHQDSLHLLEPKVRDLVWWKEVIANWYEVVESIVPDESEDEDDAGSSDGKLYCTDSNRAFRQEIVQIIQRDGKPFFWPEREQ